MQNADILALAGLRVDGRRFNEIRRIRHKLGVVPAADGSAYFEQGLNKVLVSVHGPQEPLKRLDQSASELGQVTVRLVNAPFSGTERRKRRVGDRRSAEIENTVEDALRAVIMLDLYVHSEIVVVVHLLESDGSVLCAIINAVNLAVMDAGISMRDMLVACSVGFVKNSLCQDVTQVEQNSGGAYLPVILKASTEEIIYIQLDSRLGFDYLEPAIAEAVDGCRKLKVLVDTHMKEVIEDALSKRPLTNS